MASGFRNCPGAVPVRLEVDLDDLTCCVALHDNHEERFIRRAPEDGLGRTRNATSIPRSSSVSAWTIRSCGPGSRALSSRPGVPGRIGSRPHTLRARQGPFRSSARSRTRAGTASCRSLGRPAGWTCRASLQLLGAVGGVLLIKEVLQVPPRHVVSRRHPTAPRLVVPLSSLTVGTPAVFPDPSRKDECRTLGRAIHRHQGARIGEHVGQRDLAVKQTRTRTCLQMKGELDYKLLLGNPDATRGHLRVRHESEPPDAVAAARPP